MVEAIFVCFNETIYGEILKLQYKATGSDYGLWLKFKTVVRKQLLLVKFIS
jgi:hypothetical protein